MGRVRISKRNIIYAIIVLLLFILNLRIAESGSTSYGTRMTVTETTSISNLLKKESLYLDKNIRIEGRIVYFLNKKGTEFLIEEQSGKYIKLDCTNSKLTIPVEYKGRWCIAQGLFKRNRNSFSLIIPSNDNKSSNNFMFLLNQPVVNSFNLVTDHSEYYLEAVAVIIK